ncbi:protein-methionine sulfoxide oxidase mical2b isoform X4 [Carcharodon carcharias]|uniref:protein-methionine sulfoxide oxidase mical2b isoform X4 n=1 Tax=Carcharodon carcharias TaxID=13397 RepID=UPI001B7DA66E|nr:protein-methionine sulfoxide oxidase mical2b isoform X4 [Carcharodon carcharias]
MGENDSDKNSQAGQLFENFVQASTFKGTLQAFHILCRYLDLDPLDHQMFYSLLKSKVNTWKAKALWSKLDKQANHKEYKRGNACPNTRCLIIGAGPCGLRTGIELAFLGCKVVVIEKRETFARNNVLHLWPYTIQDLRSLAAKKFYGKFCAGAIDHISIRQLQLILVKVALLLGVEIQVNVEFVQLLEPPEDQETQRTGWRAEVRPSDHPVSGFAFDVIVGADGRRSSLQGFRRKEFRGKLAIAITANFINRNTTAEAKVEEISGVAFIFNQKFFQDLKEETGIDLENIVYYKDNTHYFVMTAKKQSLLDKGVIVNDYVDTEMLLCGENVNQEALLSYAREAADFATNYQLPALDFAMNHYDQPDVAMFDFTCMYASENAALIRERCGHQLLVALVGDSLLEPFWPMGTGCARGFLAALDTAWMVKRWAEDIPSLEILAERESIYRLLPQTTPENINKNFDQYTIDPGTRYPNLNSNCVQPHQVRQLYITTDLKNCPLERINSIRKSIKVSRRESEVRPNRLLTWCQKQTESYKNVTITDLTTSWSNGLALCAIIHHFCPQLIDFDALNEEDAAKNNQLAFDVAEREFGISPVTTGKEMASVSEPDKLSMIMYLSKFYEYFRGNPRSTASAIFRQDKESSNNPSAPPTRQSNSIFNGINLLPRKRTPKQEKKSEDADATSKRRKKTDLLSQEVVNPKLDGNETKGAGNQNKVKSMATQLLAKFEENAPSSSLRRQGSLRKEFPQTLGGSDTCYFCKKRVYVMERLSADGKFFHRECFKCDFCSTTLRLGAYAFSVEEGKFYCKPHFTYCKLNNKTRKRRNHPTISHRKGESVPLSKSDGEALTNTENSCSVSSSPDKPPVCPLQSGSISCKRNKCEVGALDLSETHPTLERHSPQKSPDNLLAIRVTVTSDGSSSEAETEPHSDPSDQMISPSPGAFLPGPANKGPSPRDRETLGEEESKAGQFNSNSKAQEALRRAHSFNVPAISRQDTWREKLQTKLPLLLRKKIEPAAREIALNKVNSVENRDHVVQAPPVCSPSQLTRGYSFLNRSTWQQKAVKISELSITVSQPHLTSNTEAPLAKRQLHQLEASHSTRAAHKLSIWCNSASEKEGEEIVSGSHIRTNQIAKDEDRLVPETSTSSDQGTEQASHSKHTLTGAVGIGDSILQKLPLMKRQSQGSVKRLIHSPTRPPLSLDWNSSVTGKAAMEELQETKEAKEMKDSIGENYLLKCDTRKSSELKTESSVLTQPSISTKSDLHSPPVAPSVEGASPSGNTSGNDSPKSPLSYLVNAFRRSFPDSKTSVLSDNVEQTQEKKPKRRWARPFSNNSFHGLSLSMFHSFTEGTSLSSQDTKQPSSILPHSSLPNQHEAISSVPTYRPASGDFHNTSPFNSANEDFNKVTESENQHLNAVEKEKSPGFRENVSLKGDNSGHIQPELSSYIQRSNALFSSLRLGSPKTENNEKPVLAVDGTMLTRSKTDIWRLLANFKKRSFRDKEVKESLPSAYTSPSSSKLQNAKERPGSEDLKISTYVTESESESTSDAPSEEMFPLRRKEGQSFRRKRKMRNFALQQVKQEEVKRLHRAQIIQRQLQEVEEKQRVLEERGVLLEKALRGESELNSKEEPQLMQKWFKLVMEKNALVRYEAEMMIFARELELEDQQSRLQQLLRDQMAVDDSKKTEKEIAEEKQVLNEMLDVIKQRDKLVILLEEQRLQEKEKDQDLESWLVAKGYKLNWS